MALLKDVPTRFGIMANYWRVTEVTFNADTNQISWTVRGYISEATRKAGASPVGRSFSYQMPLSALTQPIDVKDGQGLYDALKAMLYGATKMEIAADKESPLAAAVDG